MVIQFESAITEHSKTEASTASPFAAEIYLAQAPEAGQRDTRTESPTKEVPSIDQLWDEREALMKTGDILKIQNALPRFKDAATTYDTDYASQQKIAEKRINDLGPGVEDYKWDYYKTNRRMQFQYSLLTPEQQKDISDKIAQGMDEEKAAAAYPEFARTLADFAAVPKKYPEIHREMMNILEPLGKAKLNREFARDLYGNILVASSQDGTREEIEKAYDSYDRLMFEIDPTRDSMPSGFEYLRDPLK